MPFNQDTSRALRTYDQLVTLVRAIVAASPDDESRAVEWKSGYADIRSDEASFAIARAILGLANRPVAIAQTAFEGVGYVVIGAEPQSLSGQDVPDSAEVLNAIRRYTGHGWPLWDPRSVEVDAKTVLVITVEPPRAGDRFALLRKSYQAASKKPLVVEGTVFVRQPGATERASRADLEMLQDRLIDGIAAQAELTRAEDRDREIRALVADLVHAANQWADSIQILVIMSAGTDWNQRAWMELVDSDTGRGMAVNAQLVQQNARKLRLLTNDQSLLNPLRVAEDSIKDTSNWAALHGGGASTGEERSLSYRHINAVKAAFARVEEAVIARLGESPSSSAGDSD